MRTEEQADPGREAILAAFERHGVEYVVIGGAAAQARGWPEPTEDIDLTPERSEGNLSRLAAAVEELRRAFAWTRPATQRAFGHPTASTGARFATRSRSLSDAPRKLRRRPSPRRDQRLRGDHRHGDSRDASRHCNRRARGLGRDDPALQGRGRSSQGPRRAGPYARRAWTRGLTRDGMRGVRGKRGDVSLRLGGIWAESRAKRCRFAGMSGESNQYRPFLCAFRYNRCMRSSDLLLTARWRAGLSQDQLAERLGRPQLTIARWETGQQHPPLESVIEALHACDLRAATAGLARYDDSYQSLIAQQLLPEPVERVRHLAPPWAAEGFDPIGILSELAGQARFIVIGNVAGAFHGWPILLGGRTLHVVPADASMGRVLPRRAAPRWRRSRGGKRRVAALVAARGAELHATFLPSGTRGYRDLARDAQSMQIAPGVSVRVASLIDLIRIAESSRDGDARTFVPALWATLEMRQREPQDGAGART